MGNVGEGSSGEEGKSGANECMVPDVIFFLLQKGAHKEPKRITTIEIAEAIGVSQQTASRKLISLEKEGAIERVGGKLLLSKSAVERVRKFVGEVLESLKGTSMVFGGTVTSGLAQGAYYVSQKEYLSQFEELLSFRPFPGTLNVKIDEGDIEKRITLREGQPILVMGFEKGGKKFGKIAAYRCVVNGIPGAIIFPEKSHHGLQVIEVISSFNLRKKLNLSDGARVVVEAV